MRPGAHTADWHLETVPKCLGHQLLNPSEGPGEKTATGSTRSSVTNPNLTLQPNLLVRLDILK